MKFSLTSLNLVPPKGSFTAKGGAQTDAKALNALAGSPLDDPPVYGLAYETFGKGKAGARACEAIHALAKRGSIETMLSNSQNSPARSLSLIKYRLANVQQDVRPI